MLWTGFIPRWGGVVFAGIWHCCREERQKSSDGRSLSFSEMGIIIHWAAETIWWTAGPVLRKLTPCSESGLCASSMALVSAVIVPSGLRSRLPGSTLSLHPSFQP